MANAYTGTSALSNVVTAAYDRVLEFALRAAPMHRAVVDKRPVMVDRPGSSVVFSLYADLAAATTPLTETVDPDSVAIGNPSQVTVTVNEYGNAVLTTEKVNALALTDVDMGAAELIAFNMVDTIDTLVRTAALAGTNRDTANGTAIDASPVNVNTLVNTDLFGSALARRIPTKLRGGNAVPFKGNLYAAFIHPDSSLDLRAETGAAAWRDPHNYSSASNIWAGEVGAYEGAFYVETPRAYQATDGAASAKVNRTIFFGKQGLAEAVAIEPHVVIGPVVDKLLRHRPIGWKGLLGWSVYRQAAVWRAETGTSVV